MEQNLALATRAIMRPPDHRAARLHKFDFEGTAPG
jgi:hypothetical protein